MLHRLINYVKGTVTVRLLGSGCEKVLTVLNRKGGDFWKLYRCDEQSVCITIFEKDLALLERICSRYYTDITIVHRVGVKNLLRNYKKRWGLYSGLVGGVLLIILSGCFVWDVQVTGCSEKMKVSDVIAQFEEMGLGVGTFRFGLDISDIENKFLLQNDEAVWVSVNLRFSTAYIELKEWGGQKTEVYDLTTPCDIYALRDGKIEYMMVSSGTALVQKGDSVCAGDKLVSREVLDRYGNTIIVHSIATVQAQTKRTLSVKVPLCEEKHIATGEKKSFYTLSLFNFKIPLYFKENISYNKYDITEGYKRLKIGDSFAFPFALTRKTYTEVEIHSQEVEYTVAKAQCLAEIEKQEKTNLFDAEIQNKSIKEKIVDGYLILEAEYDCIEDIAVTIGEK